MSRFNAGYTFVLARGINFFYGRYADHPICTGVDNMDVDAERTNGTKLSDLQYVNSYVNNRYTYSPDRPGFSWTTVFDRWMFLDDYFHDSGDCEDFCLTKAQMLLERGWSVSDLRLELGFSGDLSNPTFLEGHMWLNASIGAANYVLNTSQDSLMDTTAIKSEYPQLGARQISGPIWRWVDNSGAEYGPTYAPYQFTVNGIPHFDFTTEVLTMTGRLQHK